MNKYYITILLSCLSFLLIPQMAIANSFQSSQLAKKESLLFSKNSNHQTKLENNANKINSKLIDRQLSQAVIWWAVKQFDPFEGKLVEEWLLSVQQQQIHLTVDQQLWTSLDYFDRYRFTNQFGTVARKYGYSLNILDRTNQCLATYTNNWANNDSKWELNLKKMGRDGFQVDPQLAPALSIENDARS